MAGRLYFFHSLLVGIVFVCVALASVLPAPLWLESLSPDAAVGQAPAMLAHTVLSLKEKNRVHEAV